jgi:outer membrane protein
VKEDKISILIGCFAGFFANVLFHVFWDNIYPKLNIELNKYIIMVGFFLIIVFIAYYFDKRRRLKKLKKPLE